MREFIRTFMPFLEKIAKVIKYTGWLTIIIWVIVGLSCTFRGEDWKDWWVARVTGSLSFGILFAGAWWLFCNLIKNQFLTWSTKEENHKHSKPLNNNHASQSNNTIKMEINSHKNNSVQFKLERNNTKINLSNFMVKDISLMLSFEDWGVLCNKRNYNCE